MHRFFACDKIEDILFLNLKDSHHFKNVLRITEDELVEVTYKNVLYYALYKKYENNIIFLKIVDEVKNIDESYIKIDLFQAICKKDKMDLIIEKNVELGINAIYPIISYRVEKKEIEKSKTKFERYNNISKSAAMQAKRMIIPKVYDIVSIEESLNILKNYNHVLLFYEEEKKCTLKDIKINKNDKIALIIGPEGGIDERDIDILKKLDNLNILSLGNKILRTETCSFVACALINYEFNGNGVI